MQNKWDTRKTGPNRPANRGRPASRPGPIGPEGPGGSSPLVSSETCVFDFLLWSENFKGSQEKENEVSRVFLPGYLIGRDGSSGIHPNSHPFAPKQQP
jgi:hypothetical protein